MSGKSKRPEVPDSTNADDALDIFADDIDSKELEKPTPTKEQPTSSANESKLC